MKKILISVLLVYIFITGIAYADSQIVLIQIKYTVDTPQGTFSDALYYTQAEFAALPGGAIATAKAARVAAWRQAILNPPAPPDPTRSDLQRAIDEIDETRAAMLARRQVYIAACIAKGGCQ